MEYILQFARILGFCLAGEALHFLLPLPVPASIYGLLLMFIALQTGWLKPERVKAASAFLIAVFPIMFVPGTVGVMELWDVLAGLWAPILLAVFPVTALVFAVAGHVTQFLLRGRKDD
ncbi:MAG: CidA/LrgA family protein [Oscillibacter sp.]|nr:CidA/LrgA family protein [Oscillibacter sp.]